MLTIQVHDERLARQLQEIAARENRPVEEVLKTMVALYPSEVPTNVAHKPTNSDAVKRIRRTAFAEARAYWQSVGDTAKATLSDEALDEQFDAFDQEGIPRLKSEQTSSVPPVGSLAYAAKIIREMGGIETAGTLDATQADRILNEEFADYLTQHNKSDDASN